MGLYLLLTYLSLPILGFIIGNIKKLRIVNNIKTFILTLLVLLLIGLTVLTKVSFINNIIDYTIIGIGLFSFGYTASRLNSPNFSLHKGIVKTFRILLLSAYLSLPIAYYYMIMMAFKNDYIGSIVQVNDYKEYRIKHVNIHSNFTFPGFHLVTVYSKKFGFEYPIKEYNLGTYGKYGFDEQIIIDNKLIPYNKFAYNINDDELILLKYDKNMYRKSKIINTSHD